MRKILGLDLGTNSIGWALINEECGSEGTHLTGIEAAGSRIIPMTADQMGEFERGNSVSQTKERTDLRGTRRLRERFLLRRERLHRTLNILDALPEHYKASIDRMGKLLKGSEPKIEWRKNDNGKYEFIFQESFEEMLSFFKMSNPDIGDRRIPADWTLYYLRKKALTQKIRKEELAWILLNFNQKRGYYQLRGEDNETDEAKREEYMKLRVEKVTDTGRREGKRILYEVTLSNGYVYKKTSEYPLDWEGKEKEFIITTFIEKDGSLKKDKDGDIKFKIRAPKEDDWTLLKKRTESDIESSGKTVGAFIFDSIVAGPDTKITGKLIKTIERRFYRSELRSIIRKQAEFHPELNDPGLYEKCIFNLYPNNEAYRNSISSKGFEYLLIDDIIFYQRPLKSKKHLISNCPYEYRTYINKDNGEIVSEPLKCIARSNPLFQEFRIWKFISNLRIYSNDGLRQDLTSDFIPDFAAKAELFKWLNDRKEVDQESLIKKICNIRKFKDGRPDYRWNYVEDKKYPCNKTRSAVLAKLDKSEKERLCPDLLYSIWHLLYSVTTQEEIDSVFSERKKTKNGIYARLSAVFSESTIQRIKSIKFEDSESGYGSYSEKAVRKLLPLMRCGEFWNESPIQLNDRIGKLLTGEYDADIRDNLRERVASMQDRTDYQGLPEWLACYIIYGRHSEGKNTPKWESPHDIDVFLNDFRQHSLNNPIVEQVVTETLRTVRDIWNKAGNIDEIHIELGREIKNTKEQRIRDTKRITENENTNQRIRALLQEFLNPEFGIEGVRPYSPSQQELLKIYEEGALLNGDYEEYKDIITKLSSADSAKRPSRNDILRYKSWLEQNYCSPYTGQTIPLAKLFTHEYEIEHIIPQSRYFDDSFQNKVICESEVNKLKGSMLGYEFIKKHHGEIVTLTGGRTVSILSEDAYVSFVKKHFAKNAKKLQNLLLDEIPDKFINRQLNDTRYISRYVMALLSNIVRKEVAPGRYEEEATSKNVIACSGAITTKLKQDWGLNNVWNHLILPRFVRLNEITGTQKFTAISSEGHIIPNIPEELRKGFTKKRIDHRHHAMDAIVIACATRSHIHLLNNEAAKSENKEIRHQLSHKLRRYEKNIINGEERSVAKEFLKPWPTFTADVQKALENIIVSFKQNLRIINKATNRYLSYNDGNGELRLDKEGKPVKGLTVQKSNADWWAIRKPLHKDTVFGKVSLRKVKKVRLGIAMQNPDSIVDKDLKGEIKGLLKLGYDEKRIKKFFTDGENKDIWAEFNPNRIEVYYFTDDTFATRKHVNCFATENPAKVENKISESVTDTSIQRILIRHLRENDGNPSIAFSPEGIEKMNRNIKILNNGKPHHPIYKFRWYESSKSKFSVGEGNKASQYVEAAEGTNLYFAVYTTTDGTRSFETIPLNKAVERLKNKLSPVPEKNEKGNSLLFWLSPNDLVYVPDEEEITKGVNINSLNCSRIYKFVDSSGTTANFIPHRVASIIFSLPKNLAAEYCENNEIIQNEFGVGSPQSKNQKAITGEMIKEICIPIKVDRLGEVTSIGTEFSPK